MLPHGLFRRRRWRLYALRTRSLVRHHYFSLISAVVLGGAGVLAVTGGDFGDGSSLAGPAIQASDQTASSVIQAPRKTQARRMIYYIVDSREQLVEMQAAMRGDMATLRSTADYDYGQVVYLLLDSPSEESFWARFLTGLVESAPRDGYELRIIDLRQWPPPTP
jgi:hypothetical protein